MIHRFRSRSGILASLPLIATLLVISSAPSIYALQAGVPVPAGLKIPQTGSFVAASGNQYSISGSVIMVVNSAAGMTSMFHIANGRITPMSGGMDINRMLAELEAHQSASAPAVAAPGETAPPAQLPTSAPHVTPAADGSYSIALADGSTVSFLNKGTRVEVANPAITSIYPGGVKVIAMQYISAKTSIARSFLSLGHGSDAAAASPAGAWESADQDPRAGGFSEEYGPIHSRLVPAYMHTVSEEILDAMKVADAESYKVIGETAMKNIHDSPYVGGRSGGKVSDR